ncbi:MAG: hypothetical protein ABSH00_02265 [Bryobacteraceae bacterium]|jgi:hypothetical protein
MKHRFRRCTLLAAFAALCLAQAPHQPEPQAPSPHPPEAKLAGGKLQRDELLKAELAENVKDAAQLVELARQLRSDLEKNGRYVFSVADCKKVEDIEKLAHKIRTRMQHN